MVAPCDPDISIVRAEDGTLTCAGDPPDLVAFSPELIDMLRAGISNWCTIDGETIVMHVLPLALHYRLTGEVDIAGGLAAQRMTHDGHVWATATPEPAAGRGFSADTAILDEVSA